MKIKILFVLLFAVSIANAQKIIATTTITADIARNIAGDKFEIRHIVPVGGDPHLYEPVPQDAQLVAKADLILVNNDLDVLGTWVGGQLAFEGSSKMCLGV